MASQVYIGVSKWKKWTILAIGLLLWSALPAQDDGDDRPAPHVCADFLSKLQPEAQLFTIDPTKTQHLILKGGTEILVPSHCFVDTLHGAVQPERVQLSIIEIQNLYDMVRSNMGTTRDIKSYMELNLAVHVEATANRKALQFAEGKALLVRLANPPASTYLTGYHGYRGKKGKMNWSSEHYPLASEVEDLFNEEPMPHALPAYLEKGLADPRSLTFSQGRGEVGYTLEHALEGCPGALGAGAITVRLTLTGAGQADRIRITGIKDECALKALEASTRQIRWDVSRWNLKDTVKIKAHAFATAPEVLGSGVDPYAMEYGMTQNTLHRGKLLSMLLPIFGEEKAIQWMTEPYALNRMGWSAFGDSNYGQPGQNGCVKLSVDSPDAKVFMVIPSKAMVAEGRSMAGGQYCFHPHPKDVPAKVIAIVNHPTLGPHLGIVDWVTNWSTPLQVDMQAVPWDEIARRLKEL
ncbi:MAG: hypothetical protein U0176_17145 [Bacteroidia bacterium]